jgi:hypothetical protein
MFVKAPHQKARRLYTGGSKPVGCYGGEVRGFSSSELLAYERMEA